jgi:hypothetical protein
MVMQDETRAGKATGNGRMTQAERKAARLAARLRDNLKRRKGASPSTEDGGETALRDAESAATPAPESLG